VGNRAEAHVTAFNHAVTSSDWAAFVATFDPAARLEFLCVPVGPFIGAEAIAAAYRDAPPDDTIVARRVCSTADTDQIHFEWTRGGCGVLRLSWTPDGRISTMVVEFR
jgi:hypothetical protein